MAGDLKRVASKAGTMNGSKDMRGSRVLWLLCLVDDGTRQRLDDNADGVPPPASTRAALNFAPGHSPSARCALGECRGPRSMDGRRQSWRGTASGSDAKREQSSDLVHLGLDPARSICMRGPTISEQRKGL